jgi:amino acid transporter
MSNVVSGATVNAAADTTRFGYKPELARSTGRFASFAVAFAFVSIATGLFTTYGSVLNSSGPLGIWTWPITVVGQLAVAMIYGSLAARIPVTGYSYQWVSRVANPILGWIIGWVSFTFLVIVAVAVDYTIAAAVAPSLFHYTGSAANSWIITAVVLLSQALLVAYSTHWSERINNFAVTAELLGMVALVVLILIVGAISRDLTMHNLFSKGAVPSHGYFSLGTATHVGPWFLGTLLGAFTIVGFESAANLAEETKEPAQVVPRAMIQAVVASGVLGFLFLIAVTLAAGDPAKLATSGTPIADVVKHVLGTFVGDLLLVLVVVSIFACGLVIVMTAVRLTWAMSRDERFPGWQVLKTVSPTTRTPRNATFLILVVTEVVLAVFAEQTNALTILFSAATLLPAVIYLATVIMFAVKRRNLPPSGGFTLRRWETPVLVLALVWLVFEMSIFRDSSFKDPWIYALVMTAGGLLYLGYLLAARGLRGLAMPDMASIDAALDDRKPQRERAGDPGDRSGNIRHQGHRP